jgi:hypothetical protein
MDISAAQKYNPFANEDVEEDLEPQFDINDNFRTYEEPKAPVKEVPMDVKAF